MKKKEKNKLFDNLPACAAEFIKLIIKKIRYRKKVRADVMAELAAHFEDELRSCETDEEKDKKAQQLIADFGDAKLLAILLRRAKKRCRPLWRTVVARTFQTIGILILCFIIYLVWFLTGRPVITTNYVAELNRIVRPTADESLNAAPLYERAVELYNEKTSDEITKLLGTKYNEATDEQKQVIEEWLNENEEIFNLVIAGTQKPYYWQNYESKTGEVLSILMPNLSGFRNLAYALRWRIWLSAEQGRYQDAFDDIKSSYRLGQHIKGDAVLIEQFVGMAIEAVAVHALRDILSWHKIDSDRLAALQKDFESIIADEDFVVSLKAEKLTMYDEIQRCFTDDRIGNGHIYPKRLLGLSPGLCVKERSDLNSPYLIMQILFTHPNKQQTQKSINQLYDYVETLATKTAAQLHAETDVVENRLKQLIGNNIFLEVLAPAIRSIIEISSRLSADVNSTLAIIAILRYKQDTGDYPENLEELVTVGYVKELPMDPWSDKPLVYKKTDDNFVLYGFGPNFKDDGGKVFYGAKGTAMWRGSKDEGDTVFWPVYK